MRRPRIDVEPTPPELRPSLGPWRVVADVGGRVGKLYLHYGLGMECQGVADYLNSVSSPHTLRALLKALGRPELAEQVRDES